MKNYGKVKYNENTNQWTFEKLDPQVSIRLKKLFPKISESRVPPYNLTNTPEICMELEWFFMRYPVELDEESTTFLKNGSIGFKELVEDYDKILLPNYKPKKAKLKKGHKLDKDQEIASDYADKVERLILVDPMGAGKTYSAIGATLKSDLYPAAYILQAHLPKQFKDKIEEITNLKVHIIEKRTPYNLPSADIYIFKYSNISGWVDVANTGYFKQVVFDEVQEVRHGTTTAKGESAKVFSENAQKVLATTGSPIYGYGIEFFNVIDIIKPGLLGTKTEFVREWCEDNGKRIKDERAFGYYLVETYIMLNRLETLKLKDVKTKIIPQHVDYDEDAVKSTEELAKKLALDTLSSDFTLSGQSARQLDLKLREVTGVSKAKNVAHFIRMLVESGEQVLVAGWHREVYHILNKELKDLGVVMYTGSENITQKQRSKERFISGVAKVMLISHISGSGLDGLQHVCSRVVIGELAWSEQIHKQIIARLARRGQEKEVFAFLMLSNYGSDPVIRRILNIKYQQQEGILVPDKQFEKISIDKSRVKALARDYLKSLNVDISDLEKKNINNNENEKIVIDLKEEEYQDITEFDNNKKLLDNEDSLIQFDL